MKHACHLGDATLDFKISHKLSTEKFSKIGNVINANTVTSLKKLFIKGKSRRHQTEVKGPIKTSCHGNFKTHDQRTDPPNVSPQINFHLNYKVLL